MCVRILIIITKRPLRHATEVDVSVAKTLGQSVTKRLDHNKKVKEMASNETFIDVDCAKKCGLIDKII